MSCSVVNVRNLYKYDFLNLNLFWFWLLWLWFIAVIVWFILFVWCCICCCCICCCWNHWRTAGDKRFNDGGAKALCYCCWGSNCCYCCCCCCCWGTITGSGTWVSCFCCAVCYSCCWWGARTGGGRWVNGCYCWSNKGNTPISGGIWVKCGAAAAAAALGTFFVPVLVALEQLAFVVLAVLAVRVITVAVKVKFSGLRTRAGYETSNECVQVHHCTCQRAYNVS